MAEHERGLGPADRVVVQRMCLLQVLDRRVAADERFDRAELEQQLGAFRSRGRLGERTAKVCNGALRGAAGARSAGRLAQPSDDTWFARRGRAEQVRGDPFGLCPGSVEQPRRPRMPTVALGRCQGLVDRGSDQRMHEPERRLRAQDVDAGERSGGLGGGGVLQVPRARPLVGHRCRRRGSLPPAPTASPRGGCWRGGSRRSAIRRARRARGVAGRAPRSGRGRRRRSRARARAGAGDCRPSPRGRRRRSRRRRRAASRAGAGRRPRSSAARAERRSRADRRRSGPEGPGPLPVRRAAARPPPRRQGPRSAAAGTPTSAATADRSGAGHRPPATAARVRRSSPSASTGRAGSPVTNRRRARPPAGRDRTAAPQDRKRPQTARLAPARAVRPETARTAAGRRHTRMSARARSHARRALAARPRAPELSCLRDHRRLADSRRTLNREQTRAPRADVVRDRVDGCL